MKRFLLHISLLLCALTANSQINELGVFVGGINYIGDVGPTDYVAPNELAIGVLYKWNRSPRHAYRFSYTQGSLKSKDIDSDVPSRNLRGNSFENSVKEFSAGLEFNFMDFDLHDSKTKISPYVYSGVSYFIYDENDIWHFFNRSNKDKNKYNYAISLKEKFLSNYFFGQIIPRGSEIC